MDVGHKRQKCLRSKINFMSKMKFFFAITVIIISISNCSLPKIQSVSPSSISCIKRQCQMPFLKHPMQFVHSIKTVLPNGDTRVGIGVTLVSPDTGAIHCIIMTIEGMVLFEAEYDQEVVIHRSIPPFDSMDFAQNIFKDIGLVYFQPEGRLVTIGSLKCDSLICRYRQKNGSIIDVIIPKDNNWEIHQYSECYRRIRTIKACFTEKDDIYNSSADLIYKIPSKIEIIADGVFGYSLLLKLIDAERR